MVRGTAHPYCIHTYALTFLITYWQDCTRRSGCWVNHSFLHQRKATLDHINLRSSDSRLPSGRGKIKNKPKKKKKRLEYNGCECTRSVHDGCLLRVCAGDLNLGIGKVEETAEQQPWTAGESVLGQQESRLRSWSRHHDRSVFLVNLSPSRLKRAGGQNDNKGIQLKCDIEVIMWYWLWKGEKWRLWDLDLCPLRRLKAKQWNFCVPQ